MSNPSTLTRRYFLTYRGVTLPLCLSEELTLEALRNRNTYFQAEYDAAGRMLWLEKVTYGEVELRHDYRWASDGTLCGATISVPDEEPQVREFGPGVAAA